MSRRRRAPVMWLVWSNLRDGFLRPDGHCTTAVGEAGVFDGAAAVRLSNYRPGDLMAIRASDSPTRQRPDCFYPIGNETVH